MSARPCSCTSTDAPTGPRSYSSLPQVSTRSTSRLNLTLGLPAARAGNLEGIGRLCVRRASRESEAGPARVHGCGISAPGSKATGSPPERPARGGKKAAMSGVASCASCEKSSGSAARRLQIQQGGPSSGRHAAQPPSTSVASDATEHGEHCERGEPSPMRDRTKAASRRSASRGESRGEGAAGAECRAAGDDGGGARSAAGESSMSRWFAAVGKTMRFACRCGLLWQDGWPSNRPAPLGNLTRSHGYTGVRWHMSGINPQVEPCQLEANSLDAPQPRQTALAVRRRTKAGEVGPRGFSATRVLPRSVSENDVRSLIISLRGGQRVVSLCWFCSFNILTGRRKNVKEGSMPPERDTHHIAPKPPALPWITSSARPPAA
ncbi:hypothetical protein DFJ74DRAFT_682020 [Hyaloraphidium curvatum]|nr:hypothetical protein DFJ74DRAFT_682020 [Hyaloraphidium curvatum]